LLQWRGHMLAKLLQKFQFNFPHPFSWNLVFVQFFLDSKSVMNHNLMMQQIVFTFLSLIIKVLRLSRKVSDASFFATYSSRLFFIECVMCSYVVHVSCVAWISRKRSTFSMRWDISIMSFVLTSNDLVRDSASGFELRLSNLVSFFSDCERAFAGPEWSRFWPYVSFQ
jgi:hypothetical protein